MSTTALMFSFVIIITVSDTPFVLLVNYINVVLLTRSSWCEKHLDGYTSPRTFCLRRCRCDLMTVSSWRSLGGVLHLERQRLLGRCVGITPPCRNRCTFWTLSRRLWLPLAPSTQHFLLHTRALWDTAVARLPLHLKGAEKCEFRWLEWFWRCTSYPKFQRRSWRCLRRLRPLLSLRRRLIASSSTSCCLLHCKPSRGLYLRCDHLEKQFLRRVSSRPLYPRYQMGSNGLGAWGRLCQEERLMSPSGVPSGSR